MGILKHKQGVCKPSENTEMQVCVHKHQVIVDIFCKRSYSGIYFFSLLQFVDKTKVYF